MWYHAQSQSIANTFGLDGFIVIGFDDREKKFYPASFKDSGLKDTSDLTAIINKSVDRLFEINHHEITYKDKRLSILHIPPSLNKPHVLRVHRVFKDGTNPR